ncbi:MAG: DUF1761 domain-containing protein [Chloroflexota bacterium]|nr:DUF1761 domain-containing protein [Chloroflexota bacterium]
MTLDFANVDWLAVIIATVAGLVIGFVWYAPPVFGRRWAKAAGVELGNPAPTVYIGSVIATLVAAAVLAVLAASVAVANIVDGAILGALVAVGLVAPWAAMQWLYERRSVEWFGINAGYALVALTVMGAIIGYF